MKKILSLLALLMLCIVGANAEEATYKIEATVSGTKTTLSDAATLPYESTFKACYQAATGSAPNAMIQVTGVSLTEGDNVTLGELNGWDTPFTVTGEGTAKFTVTLSMGSVSVIFAVTKNGGTEEPVVETKTITLVPGPWDVDGARFAAYVWNGEGNQWIDFAKADDNYAAALPADMTGLILARMNGETTENNFNEGVCWNKTADIDFTAIADQTVFVITDWAAYQTYTPAEYALVSAKAQLQEAIDKVKAYGLSELADAVAAAQAAVDAEDATLASLMNAAQAFEAAVNNYLQQALPQAISLVSMLNSYLPMPLLDNAITTAQAVADKEDATTEELAKALQDLLNAANPYAKIALGQVIEKVDQLVASAGLLNIEISEALTTAITAAKAVNSNTAATTQEIAAVLTNLMDVILEPAKEVLNQVLVLATKINADDALTTALSEAQAVANNKDATVMQIADALQKVMSAALAPAKAMLQKVIELAEMLHSESLATIIAQAQALANNDQATVIELVVELKALVQAAMPEAEKLLATAKAYMATFDGAAAAALEGDFDKLVADIKAQDISAIKADVEALFVKAKPYIESAIDKLESYAADMNNETLNADIAALKTAYENKSLGGLFTAVKAFETHFCTVAAAYLAQVKAIDTTGKNGVEALNAAIKALEDELAAESPKLMAVALATRNLVLAVNKFEEANTYYTVVGGFDDEGDKDNVLFGKQWNATLTDNDMVKGADGIWTKTFENVQLEVSTTILYKVVKNHDWNVQSWGFGEYNAEYVVTETGKYNVKFSFNPNATLSNGYNLTCELGDPDWSAIIADAEALADENAVAVGKLLAAIETAKAATGTADDKAALQAAIEQYNADNADQENDQTAKVATNGWKKFDGNKADLAPSWAAPSVTTYDGRTSQPAEVYEQGATAADRTGNIIYQDITGLVNGTYKVGFYGTAYFTPDRGFESEMEDGATDVAYVFANDEKSFITAHRGVSFTEYSLLQFDVEVTDGNIKLGLGKEKAGTNWHTMQIYQLTWFATAKEVYAELQTELGALLAKAKALTGSADKTALEAAIATAEEATTTKANWYNIAEIEGIIANLKDAADAYEIANRFTYNGVAYVIDTESGKFMAAGHDYGTRGIVNEIGLDLTFSTNADNTVDIETGVKNSDTNHFLGSNLYMDSSSYGWILLEQEYGFYIQNVEGQYISVDNNENLVMSDTPHLWLIVTPEGVQAQRLEDMKEATAENPVDVTWMIKAQGFNRNDVRNSSWNTWSEQEGGNTNLNICGGTDANRCAESYHAHFYVKQTIEGAPAGLYKMTAQGFYRQDDSAEEAAPVFFIGSRTANVPVKTGEENSMSDASNSFAAGKYTIEPIEFKLFADGNIELGVKQEEAFHQWVIFDNFQLTYYGPAEPENYTIVGAVGADIEANAEDVIFTQAWNPGFEANEMDLDPETGNYVFELSAPVRLEVGETVYYKVVKDHSWDINWGFADKEDGNAEFVVWAPEGSTLISGGSNELREHWFGYFNVKFIFNPYQAINGDYNLTAEINFNEEKTATAISDIAVEAAKNGTIYNLNGQRVTNPKKGGLYIINGKKQVVR